MLVEFYRRGTEKVDCDVYIQNDGRVVKKARTARKVKRVEVDLGIYPFVPEPIALAMINQIMRYDVVVVAFYGFDKGL